MSDTTSEIEQLMFLKNSELSASEKIQRMAELMEAGRELIKAAIRAKTPLISEQELDRQFAQHVLGAELADKFLAAKESKKLNV